jgi:hypothetical protein
LGMEKKRPIDINLLARQIVEEAIGEPLMPQVEQEKPIEPKPSIKEKNAAAVALGRLGGLKGGKARAENLTPEQRKEAARLAALARWKKTTD